jgi:hypothetical protein
LYTFLQLYFQSLHQSVYFPPAIFESLNLFMNFSPALLWIFPSIQELFFRTTSNLSIHSWTFLQTYFESFHPFMNFSSDLLW